MSFLALLTGISVCAIYAIVQVVRFWVGFAQGINEANGQPRGFEVKQTTGEPPDTSQSR